MTTVTFHAKLVIAKEEAKDILEKLAISEDEAELESYYAKTYSISFPNGNVAEIRFCFDGSGWAEANMFDKNGNFLYWAEPSSEFFGVWTLLDGDPSEEHNTYEIRVVRDGDEEE